MKSQNYEIIKRIIKKSMELKRDKKYPEAKQLLLDGLQKFPQNNFLKASLGELFLREKNFFESERLADEILHMDYENFQGLLLKGMIYYEKRYYKDALDFFLHAYSQKRTGYLSSYLVRTYLKLEQPEKALQVCQEWEEREPDNVYLKKLKARPLEALNKEEQAKKLYEEIRKDSGDGFAYREEIRLKLKDLPPEKAVRELEKIIKVKGEDESIHLHLQLARELEKLKNYREAVKHYKKVLEKEPGNPFVLKQLGFCYSRLKEYEKALECLKKAFELDPTDYYVRSSLLFCYRKLNRQTDAIKFFKKIINQNPDFKNLWGIVKKLEKEVTAANEDQGTDRSADD